MDIVLSSSNIILRKLRNEDASSLSRNANNPNVGKFLNLPYPYTIETAKDFINESHRKIENGSRYELGIEYQGKIIGIANIHNICRNNRNAELGFWIGEDFWGKGIGTESIKLLLKFGFKELNMERIYGRIREGNIASVKVFEKLGFTFEGRLRHNVRKEDQRIDHLLYSILREERILKN